MVNKKSSPARLLAGVSDMPFVRTDKSGGFIIDIQVVPNAAKTQLEGLYGKDGHDSPIALKLRLKAAPVEGQANEALIKWLASQLGIARNSLELLRGQTSRRKQLRISAEAAATANWQQLTDQLHLQHTQDLI